jgi:hypothetical protein
MLFPFKQGNNENMTIIEDGMIVAGIECFPPPSIEQGFGANPFGEEGDGAHCLMSLRLKLSRAEQIVAASENAQRMNTDTNMDALLV